MRGKGNFHVVTHTKVGITPAYAGKRIAELQTPAVSWDHPRVCGEKRLRLVFICGMLGSPPRMRGKVENTVEKHTDHRITPAYAGKSYAPAFSFPILEDHPRVCGEKTVFRTNGPTTEGSPPRMRGKACSWP